MTIKCETAQELLPALIEGTLDHEYIQQVEEHLAECEPCRELESAERFGRSVIGAICVEEILQQAKHELAKVNTTEPYSSLPPLALEDWNRLPLQDNVLLDFEPFKETPPAATFTFDQPEAELPVSSGLPDTARESQSQELTGWLRFSDGREVPFRLARRGSDELELYCQRLPAGLVPARLRIVERTQ